MQFEEASDIDPKMAYAWKPDNFPKNPAKAHKPHYEALLQAQKHYMTIGPYTQDPNLKLRNPRNRDPATKEN